MRAMNSILKTKMSMTALRELDLEWWSRSDKIDGAYGWVVKGDQVAHEL